MCVCVCVCVILLPSIVMLQKCHREVTPDNEGGISIYIYAICELNAISDVIRKAVK